MMRLPLTALFLQMASGFVGKPLTTRSFLSSKRIRPVSHPLSARAQQWELNCPVNPDDTIEMLEMDAEDAYIESVVDQITGYIGGEIMRPYKPDRGWLWSRWTGTILQHGTKKAIENMIYALVCCLCLNLITGSPLLAIEVNPADCNHYLLDFLQVFNKVWHYSITLTTFILTFFLTQAYSFWKNMYSIGRKVQGRLNDIGMLAATYTKRDEQGNFTKEGSELLDDVAQNIRLFSPFMWASQSRRFRVLLTKRGMEAMVGVIDVSNVSSTHRSSVLY
jgi:hypothetical protein